MPFRGDLTVQDEATLIPSLLENDERAWRIFHERYGNRLQGAISKVTRQFPQLTGTDHVDEIYGVVCLRLLSDDKRRLRSFDPERGTPLGCWLCALARNSAYDFLRSRRRQPWLNRLGEDVSPSAEPVCEAPDAFSVCCNREQVRMLQELLETLSARDQEFMTAYLQGLEAEQIAEQLGISLGTVYSKKHKILERLEKLLQN
jgi:RNA polymerase sigma-70 factor (ECF subfamily)